MPDGSPVIAQYGTVATLAEAERQFVEVVARIRLTEQQDGFRPRDEDDQLTLADALMHAHDIDLAGLYKLYGPRIEEAYARIAAQEAAPTPAGTGMVGDGSTTQSGFVFALPKTIASDVAAGHTRGPVLPPFANPQENHDYRGTVENAYRAWAGTDAARGLLRGDEIPPSLGGSRPQTLRAAARAVQACWNDAAALARVAGPTAGLVVAARFRRLTRAARDLAEALGPSNETDQVHYTALIQLSSQARRYADRTEITAAAMHGMRPPPTLDLHQATSKMAAVEEAIDAVAAARSAGFRFEGHTDPAAAGEYLRQGIIRGLAEMEEDLADLPPGEWLVDTDDRFAIGALYGVTLYAGMHRAPDGTVRAVMGFDDAGLEPVRLTRAEAEQISPQRLVELLEERLNGLDQAHAEAHAEAHAAARTDRHASRLASVAAELADMGATVEAENYTDPWVVVPAGDGVIEVSPLPDHQRRTLFAGDDCYTVIALPSSGGGPGPRGLQAVTVAAGTAAAIRDVARRSGLVPAPQLHTNLDTHVDTAVHVGEARPSSPARTAAKGFTATPAGRQQAVPSGGQPATTPQPATAPGPTPARPADLPRR